MTPEQQMFAFGWGGFSAPAGDDYFGGPGRSGRKRGQVINYHQQPYLTHVPYNYIQSSATDELKAAGFNKQAANDAIRWARLGQLEFGPEMYRHGETRNLSAGSWLPYFRDTQRVAGLAPEVLMQRGLALRAALEALQNKWISKRGKR